MRFFKKEEVIAILVIFGVLVAVSIPNFSLSIKRARDASRKDDMGSLQAALNSYFKDFGEFPGSTSDGRIVGCKAPGSVVKKDAQGKLIVDFIPCEWGKDGLADPTDGSRPAYISPIPNDPQAATGLKYFYISDGSRYQIYGSLEDTTQDEYDKKIVARGISCGVRICNFGRSYGRTPLNISIEQYEQTLQK